MFPRIRKKQKLELPRGEIRLMLEDEDLFEFGNPNFRSTCCAAMAEMRCRGEHCDVILQVGNENIAAHRVVLASAIPFFRMMFGSNMLESKKREIRMEEVDPGALKCLIDLAYMGELRVASDQVPSLFRASQYLGLGIVSKACLDFLKPRINAHNAFTVRSCAEVANNTEMLEKADSFIRQNFEDVCISEEFLDLTFHELRELISCDDLYVASEDTVFQSVIKWVKAYEDERKFHLPELLLYVRMPFLTPEYLATRVSNEELIRTSPLCTEIVGEARRYHLPGTPRSAYCPFVIRERYCKGKNHLKCARIVGCGVYSISSSYKPGNTCIKYYDYFNERWDTLGNFFGISPDYAVCTDERIYFIAGTGLQVLDLRTLKLEHKNIPVSFTEFAGIAFYNKKVYFFGCICRWSRAVRFLDLQTLMCRQSGKMTEKRESPGAVPHAGFIYIIGGRNETTRLRSVERFNPSTGNSSEVSPMLIERSCLECASVNDKIYVCGADSSMEGNSRLTQFAVGVEVYDTATDQWNLVRKLVGITQSFSLFSYSNELHAIQRFWGDSTYECSVQIYDPHSDEWRSQQSKLTFPWSCLSRNQYKPVTVVLTNAASKFRIG